MLDRAARRLVGPALLSLVPIADKLGLSANRLTQLGFVFGLGAVVAIANGNYVIGLVFILFNRLCDGLDGEVARAHRPTDLGGYLDIVADFLFYAGVIFAFALADSKNAVVASFVLFSFIGTGTTFLAFAVFAAKHRLQQAEHRGRAFYYLGGLTEGTETLLFFIIICLWPSFFRPLGALFGFLCLITTIVRVAAALQALRLPRHSDFSSEQ
ncbi:MAG TPA: CDP-alcohol phosphatidyltransferase family protein [Dongiaceae bacterium]|jgi:phosphatidylglycerophosphate synthase|nr:CDP-alcohol phosphatidyltransferase family protein [Dongiaceae bacterium]